MHQELNKEVKLSLCLTKHHTMKVYYKNEGVAPCILNVGHFIPRLRTYGIHWIGGWMGPRLGLESMTRKVLSLPMLGIEACSSSPYPSVY